jgi:hypothetical protein
MARKLTFVHPRTGETFTRTTEADYTHISVKGGQAQWHLTRAAADRRGGEVFPVPGPSAQTVTSEPERLFEDRRGNGCTVSVSGGKCGKPAVKSWTNRSGETFHECAEHA